MQFNANINVNFRAQPELIEALGNIGTFLETLVFIRENEKATSPNTVPDALQKAHANKVMRKATEAPRTGAQEAEEPKAEEAKYDEKVARKNTQEPEKVVSEKPAAKMKPVSPRKAKENEDIVSLPSRAEQEKAKAEEPKEKSEKELRAQARKIAGEVSRSGKVDAVKALIAKYEAKKLSDIPTDKLADFIKEVEAL